ncbi:MAG: tetratricopeptide repeat protein, partial [Bacteroidia bacterium]|nr:tetratricopeptide repeat protein [Bacteroidia bacterium]
MMPRMIWLPVVTVFLSGSLLAQTITDSTKTGKKKPNLEKTRRLISKRKFHKAIPILHSALNQDITNARAHFQLGECYYFTDRIERALPYFEFAYF